MLCFKKKIPQNLPEIGNGVVLDKCFFRGNKGDLYQVPPNICIAERSDFVICDIEEGPTTYKIREKGSEIFLLKTNFDDLQNEFVVIIDNLECFKEDEKITANVAFKVDADFIVEDVRAFINTYQSEIPLSIWNGKYEIENMLRNLVIKEITMFIKSREFGRVSYPISYEELVSNFNREQDGNFLRLRGINKYLNDKNCGIRLREIKLLSIRER